MRKNIYLLLASTAVLASLQPTDAAFGAVTDWFSGECAHKICCKWASTMVFFLPFFLLTYFFFFISTDKTEDLGDKLNDAFEGAADWGKEQLGTYCHALISLFCDTATPVERISASLLLIY